MRLEANGRLGRRYTASRSVNRLKYKGNLINLDHPDILMYYNSVLRGLQNYYAIAKNRTDVTWVG